MEIQVVTGVIQSVQDELIVVNMFEAAPALGGATAVVDQALGGAIAEAIACGDLRGKKGETALLYTRGALPAKRVVVVGLGKEEGFGLDQVRWASAAAARKARELGVRSYTSIVHGIGAAALPPDAAAQAVAEGTLLGLYRYQELKSEPADRADPERLTLVVLDAELAPAVQVGAHIGQVVAEAACLARDWTNRPANMATPSDLADEAEEIAAGLPPMTCQVIDEEQAAELGMGAFIGVAQGSEEPAAFVVMEHNPGRQDLDTIVLVGKGITFDSGGISLKPAEDMDRMRDDMGGAAAVLGAMWAVGRLQLPLHVVGLMPLTENLPSGYAYKPGDVLRAMNGKTIEILSTDAEGRLVLADALVYAGRFQPRAVVDLATLTGACVVALGKGVAAGAFSTDSALLVRLQAAAAATGEKIWPMPLYDEYKDSIESLTADLSNTGGRMGGVGTSAIFLKEFAEGYPWAHLDIAGMVFEERPATPKRPPHLAKGGTGFGVRLLVQFLRDWANGG